MFPHIGVSEGLEARERPFWQAVSDFLGESPFSGDLVLLSGSGSSGGVIKRLIFDLLFARVTHVNATTGLL